MSLDFLKGACRFRDIGGKFKESGQTFLTVKTVDLSIAWRHLLKRKILMDIKIENAHLLIPKDLKKLSFPKKETQDITDTFFPLKIEQVDLQDSSITFEKYKSLKENKPLKISAINGRILNLTPSPQIPLSSFNVTAKLIDPNSKFKFGGKFNRLATPIPWSVDIEVEDFDIVTLDPYLKSHVPLTFTKGTLDLYSEVLSKEGQVRGYFKPLLKDIDVVSNKEKFIGAKHFGIEMITALVNLILRDKKTKSIATIIDFKYDKKLSFNIKKGLSKAAKQGSENEVRPGFENRYRLQ
ncbi:MAG TPA: DUF748 domain-containing protein [Pseudobdellovibrionaceae bacterium]